MDLARDNSDATSFRMASNGRSAHGAHKPHKPHTATAFKDKTTEGLSELQGLVENVHGLTTAHMTATNTSAAQTQETLVSMNVLVRNLCQELAASREEQNKNNKRMRQLQLMQAHAALYGSLTPTLEPDDSRDNLLLIHIALLYKSPPQLLHDDWHTMSRYDQAKVAQEFLGYVLSGYNHSGVSFADLSCV